MSQQPKKRILSASSDYYAPKLPEDANLLTVCSDRVSSDVHAYQAVRSSSELSTRSPSLPDDLRAKLVHVGMNVRMNVSRGYKTAGTFPSFEGTDQSIKASASRSIHGGGASADIPSNSFQIPSEPVRRFYSEGGALSGKPRVLSTGKSRSLSSRKNLKRTHQIAGLDNSEPNLANDEQRGSIGEEEEEFNSEADQIIPATAFVQPNFDEESNPNLTAQPESESPVKPSHLGSVHDDFEEAPFLHIDQ